MSTMAAFLEKGDPAVIVIKGRHREVIRDGGLLEALMRASSLYLRARRIEEELKEAKALILERARPLSGEEGTVTFHAGGVSCKVTRRYEAVIPEENLKEARRLLGRRFKDLVRVKTRHLATRRLVEEAASVKGLAETFVIRELSPQFVWGVTDSS